MVKLAKNLSSIVCLISAIGAVTNPPPHLTLKSHGQIDHSELTIGLTVQNSSRLTLHQPLDLHLILMM